MHALRIPGTSLTPVGADAGGAGEGAARQFPEVERVLRQDRHRRGRHRPDAAERRRHLHHAEAARRMARPASAPRPSWWPRCEKRVEPSSRQQLRVHPADPDALQRADLGRAQRRRRQGLRRRPRHAARRSPTAIAGGASQACPARPTCRSSRSTGLPMLTVDARPRRPGALRPERRRRAGGRRHRRRRQGGRAGLRGRPALRHRGAPARASARRPRGARRPADPVPPCAGERGARRPAVADRFGARALRAAVGGRQLEVAPGPNQISRENGKRRVVVTRQRARPRPRLVRRRSRSARWPAKVELPAGYWIG